MKKCVLTVIAALLLFMNASLVSGLPIESDNDGGGGTGDFWQYVYFDSAPAQTINSVNFTTNMHVYEFNVEYSWLFHSIIEYNQRLYVKHGDEFITDTCSDLSGNVLYLGENTSDLYGILNNQFITSTTSYASAGLLSNFHMGDNYYRYSSVVEPHHEVFEKYDICQYYDVFALEEVYSPEYIYFWEPYYSNYVDNRVVYISLSSLLVDLNQVFVDLTLEQQNLVNYVFQALITGVSITPAIVQSVTQYISQTTAGSALSAGGGVTYALAIIALLSIQDMYIDFINTLEINSILDLDNIDCGGQVLKLSFYQTISSYGMGPQQFQSEILNTKDHISLYDKNYFEYQNVLGKINRVEATVENIGDAYNNILPYSILDELFSIFE